MKKLITKDRYEGLDPQVAEELKKGNLVYGEFWDIDTVPTKGHLMDYWSRLSYKYIREIGVAYRNFKPIYKEETDWSKVPEGTPIYCWGGEERPKYPRMRYFVRYEKDNEESHPFIAVSADNFKELGYKHAELIPEFQKEKK